MVDRRRRDFLVRCCQSIAASWLPSCLHGQIVSAGNSLFSLALPAIAHEFHVYPHYRAQTPLDSTLLKASASQDDFISERLHDVIATRFTEWSAALRQSPGNIEPVAKILTPDFTGSSARPLSSHMLRSNAGVDAWKSEFSTASLNRDEFSRDLHAGLSSFSEIHTAEFQIAGLDVLRVPSSFASTFTTLRTRVRYEIVGPVSGFWREQRVGYWDIEWSGDVSNEFTIRSWRALEETRSRAVRPAFTDITAQTVGGNPSYSSQLSLGADHWRTVLDGACGIDIYGHNGIAVGDFDNDGFDDLYVCQPAGLPNRLYRNRGDGSFVDATDETGLGILDNTACALFADINNNGLQDLIVVRTSGPLLFMNQGGGKFRKHPDAFRFASPPEGTFTGAALADYDRDGWLDIYFCLYAYYQGTGQYKYPAPYHDAENGPPNFMMRNNRDGTFRDVTKETGLDQNNTRYSFCCGWSDYNGDGWPDLYVVNDFGRKNLYRNNGDGTLTDIATQAGVDDVGAGMSVCWFADNSEGLEDLYVADMWTAAGERIASQDAFKESSPPDVRALYRKHAMGNSLFQNNGHGSFRDVTGPSGVAMGRWSWSSDVFDFDHDGLQDLYIVNGMLTGTSREDLNSFFWRQTVAKSPETGKSSAAYEQGWGAINELVRSDGTWSGFERNVFYANNGDGTFSDVSAVVGMDFLEDGRAFALCDLDHDGRLEVILKNRNAPQVRIMKNVLTGLPPSVSFRLRGTKSNRDAIGAAVTIETERGKQTRQIQAGSGFLSQHTKDLLFGLGDATRLLKVTVRWPGGLVQDFSGMPIKHRITIEEGKEAFVSEPFRVHSAEGNSTSAFPREQYPSQAVIETWLLEPIPAPSVSLPSMSGAVRTLTEFRGKPLMLCFWTADSQDTASTLAAVRKLRSRAQSGELQVCAVHLEGDTRPMTDLSRLVDRDLADIVLRGTEDVAAVYSLLFRYLFDRHRDLPLPTSFLIDEVGQIVKVYQGLPTAEIVQRDSRNIPRTEAARLQKALPFQGSSHGLEFGRNYISLGSVFFQRGYTEQAGQWFQIASDNDPGSAEAAYGLGSVYLKQENNEAARKNFLRATTLHAGYPDTIPNAWNNLGLLATREGRTGEALQYFEQALKLSPNHIVALDNLGNAYRQLHRWSEAHQVLEKAVSLSPEDPDAAYSLGMVFAQTNDTEHAFQYLQRALQYRPAYPEALNNLGILYLRTDQQARAIASFRESIRVAPVFDQSYLNLARVLVLQGDHAQATAVLLELLKQHPGHAEAQSLLEKLSH